MGGESGDILVALGYQRWKRLRSVAGATNSNMTEIVRWLVDEHLEAWVPYRHKIYGPRLGPARPKRPTGEIDDRLLKIVRPRFNKRWKRDKSTGCKIWTKPGRAQFSMGGVIYQAQEAAIILDTGTPIGVEFMVEMTCGNRSCVNTDHMIVKRKLREVKDER